MENDENLIKQKDQHFNQKKDKKLFSLHDKKNEIIMSNENSRFKLIINFINVVSNIYSQ